MTETVYLLNDGAILRREGRRLRVFRDRKLESEIPTEALKQLVVMGGVTVTASALDLLIGAGIDTVFLSHYGRFRGRLLGRLSGNIRLRIAQFEAFSDRARSMAIAKRIVAGKLSNQRTYLMRHLRRRASDPEDAFHRAKVALAACQTRLDMALTMDEVRGCEGSGAAAYFRVFGRMIEGRGFRFDGRNRRPPMDPVNALLSLGYTLLFNSVQSAGEVVGLDPYLGTLHAQKNNRPSLICDMVEEFRAPVIDALVVSSINRGAFKPDDFEDRSPQEPVVLKRETMRWFLTLFERRMEQRTVYGPRRVRLSLRQIVEQQMRAMARQVLGEEDYHPFEIR